MIRQRVLIPAGIIFCLTLAVLCVFLFAKQRFQNFCRAQFESPTISTNNIVFYDGGILDRDLFLYANPKGQKIQFVSSLVDFPDVDFHCAQWTKDGQVIVCSLYVKSGDVNQALIKAVAFDFSKNKSISPSWLTKSSDEQRSIIDWKKQESIVDAIIIAHGGLTDQKIDNEMLKKSESTLWFWQELPR